MKFILVVAGVLAMAGGAVVYTQRGLRNNNPGNIRDNQQNDWLGRVGKDDKGFVIFDKPENGIRAIVRTLDSYARRGINTVGEIISTWAPDVENNTASYVAHAAKKLGKSPGDAVSRAEYAELIEVIILHENGRQPYDRGTILRGIAAA